MPFLSAEPPVDSRRTALYNNGTRIRIERREGDRMKKWSSMRRQRDCFVLLCVVGVYGTFLRRGTSAARSMTRFRGRRTAIRRSRAARFYNHAFPSEEITLSAENRETIAKLLADSKGTRRFSGSWTPYGTNTRMPCTVLVETESAEGGLQALSVQGVRRQSSCY